MNLTAAALIAQVISFVVFIIAAAWYVAPWMKHRPLEQALPALLWVQAFRGVAMQIFSARKFGFVVTAGLARQIAWGDVAGAALALACLWLLRYRSRWARSLLWVFVAETVIDLANATVQGIHQMAFTTASSVTWVILNFYAPLLWVTIVLIAWRLSRSAADMPLPEARSGAGSAT